MSLSSARLRHAGLIEIADRLASGERLSLADGVRLFEAPDLLAVGWLANREREKRHGSRTYYNYNIRIEATNVSPWIVRPPTIADATGCTGVSRTVTVELLLMLSS